MMIQFCNKGLGTKSQIYYPFGDLVSLRQRVFQNEKLLGENVEYVVFKKKID